MRFLQSAMLLLYYVVFQFNSAVFLLAVALCYATFAVCKVIFLVCSVQVAVCNVPVALCNYDAVFIVAIRNNAAASYNIHIFMHPADDIGSQGFTIKKRKSLSDEEKREFDMHVTTGKVNQLNIEKTYLDNLQDEDSVENDRNHNERNENHHHKKSRDNNNNDRRRNNRRYDRRKFDDRNYQDKKKKSVLQKLFSFGKN